MCIGVKGLIYNKLYEITNKDISVLQCYAISHQVYGLWVQIMRSLSLMFFPKKLIYSGTECEENIVVILCNNI